MSGEKIIPHLPPSICRVHLPAPAGTIARSSETP
jgi:hypothetical protein